MPEISPLTKDQLFEKKIAENTGSNYNVGDISDVVPVTKDQSLLKEIALNSAGLSEDITELEGKVTANAEAIEAMENVLGAKNQFALAYNLGTTGLSTANDKLTNTLTDGQTTFLFYFRAYNQDLTNIELASALISNIGKCEFNVTIPSGYAYLKFKHNGASQDLGIDIPMVKPGNWILSFNIVGYNPSVVGGLEITEIMLRPAGTDPTYVPYAMTNRELTTDVKWLKDKTFVAIPQGGLFSYLVDEKGYFVAINRQDDAGAIYYTSGSTVIRIAGSDVVDQMISISNRVVTITNNVSGTIHASIF